MADRHHGGQRTRLKRSVLVLVTVALAGGSLTGCGTEVDACSSAQAAPLPNVWGQHLDDARAELREGGFCNVHWRNAAGSTDIGTLSDWTVAQQHPAPERNVRRSRRIVLTVIPNPPTPTTVDPLADLTPEERAAFNDFVNPPPPTTEPRPPITAAPDYYLEWGGCQQEFGGLTWGGTIRNQESVTNTYQIDVAWTSSNGVRLDTGTAYVESVAPGQTAAWSAVGYSDFDFSGGECTIEDVDWIPDY